jgi:glycosyltransferase involved in cell wall biosynthesis
VGGVEQLFYAALQGLVEAVPSGRVLVVCRPDVAAILSDRGYDRTLDVEVIETGSRNRFVLESTHLPGFLRRAACDVVWFPNYFLPPTVRVPAVVTVTDLQFRHFPEYFSRSKRLWLRIALPWTMHWAREVVAISQWAAADFERFYGRRPTVIPIGAALSDSGAACAADRRAHRPLRLLVMSHQYPHKNIPTVIAAMQDLSPEAFELHVVGQLGSGSGAVQVAKASLPPGCAVRAHGYLPRAELEALLRGTDILLFPSLFEGFGMPVVEALSVGVTVIASDLPVLREVSLGRAYFIRDARNPTAWADMIRRVAQEDRRRPTAHDVNTIRTAFSAKRFGERYLEVFHRVAGGRP